MVGEPLQVTDWHGGELRQHPGVRLADVHLQACRRRRLAIPGHDLRLGQKSQRTAARPAAGCHGHPAEGSAVLDRREPRQLAAHDLPLLGRGRRRQREHVRRQHSHRHGDAAPPRREAALLPHPPQGLGEGARIDDPTTANAPHRRRPMGQPLDDHLAPVGFYFHGANDHRSDFQAHRGAPFELMFHNNTQLAKITPDI